MKFQPNGASAVLAAGTAAARILGPARPRGVAGGTGPASVSGEHPPAALEEGRNQGNRVNTVRRCRFVPTLGLRRSASAALYGTFVRTADSRETDLAKSRAQPGWCR